MIHYLHDVHFYYIFVRVPVPRAVLLLKFNIPFGILLRRRREERKKNGFYFFVCFVLCIRTTTKDNTINVHNGMSILLYRYVPTKII